MKRACLLSLISMLFVYHMLAAMEKDEVTPKCLSLSSLSSSQRLRRVGLRISDKISDRVQLLNEIEPHNEFLKYLKRSQLSKQLDIEKVLPLFKEVDGAGAFPYKSLLEIVLRGLLTHNSCSQLARAVGSYEDIDEVLHKLVWGGTDGKDTSALILALLAGYNPNAPYSKRIKATALYDLPVEQCKLLVALGADVNVKNEDDETPLHTACFWLNRKKVQLFLQAGAFVCVKDNKGKTPEHWLLQRRWNASKGDDQKIDEILKVLTIYKMKEEEDSIQFEQWRFKNS